MIGTWTIKGGRLKVASSEAIEVCEREEREAIAWLAWESGIKLVSWGAWLISMQSAKVLVYVVVYSNRFMSINTLKKSKARNCIYKKFD